ncbi:MAG: MYXO-CTERM sorting domain-containing protein, partial [Polyangiaceae bacterium]
IVSATGFAANTSQIVRIPEYTTLSITGAGTIVAAPWDGTKGGIVAIFANNTVTNDTLISAATSGFRGGVLLNDDLVNGCLANDGPVVPAAGPIDFNILAGGAKKGEGLLPANFSTLTTNPSDLANFPTYGRGNITNGGGGGDCSNSGGAGGGHGGIGGSGGVTWTGETDVGGVMVGSRAVGGTGGAPLLYAPTARLAFGGGGGAGEENNSVGTAGASGGGVVLLRVAALAGAGTISADGATAANAGNDGAGGGGAGGLIVVLSATDATCGGLHAVGGTGGSCSAGHGPGGGGSGGVILLQSASGTCGKTITGGASGLDASNAARGANAGAAGTLTTPGSGGFTPFTCNVAIDHCGGCVINNDCGSGGTCNTTTNTCSLLDGGAGDGGTDGGVGDAGTDGGTLTDGGLADGGSKDGGSNDGGALADGGNSGDGGGNGDDGGNSNVVFPGDIEGGGCGCSTPGSDDSGSGTAALGLGLMAGLAFLRRKKR